VECGNSLPLLFLLISEKDKSAAEAGALQNETKAAQPKGLPQPTPNL
jgi:hypothetical protein